MSVPTASEILAEFAAGLRPEHISAPVAAAAKRHLLDVLGVALASSPMPFARMALQTAAALGGQGDGSVIGFADRLPPVWSALVNGALAHGIDFDDTHEESVVHVSCSVAPAALAAAEMSGASGARFLTALVLGMETAVRLGLAAPGRFHDRGFHPTGVCGAFATTLVAGTLAGLPAAALADALGLSGSMASGLMEFLTDGTWSKRIHSGWAAHSGLVAARLASTGFRGPRAVLDGRFGFYRSHLGDEGWNAERVTADLGRRWHMMEIAIKPYPACHMTHAFIDCAASLRRGGRDARHDCRGRVLHPSARDADRLQAARLEAGAAERLRCQVQPAIYGRLHAGTRTRRPRRLHAGSDPRRRDARAGASRRVHPRSARELSAHLPRPPAHDAARRAHAGARRAAQPRQRRTPVVG
jgi:2-methylcitrate dehydratase PrpD